MEENMKSGMLTSITGACLLLILGACSNADLIREVERSKVGGDAYSKALHSEYVALAKSEEAEGDQEDALHFINKAKVAAAGQTVTADDFTKRDLRGVSEEKALKEAHSQLNSALKGGAAKRNPKAAAKALGMFDCWMQEAEEDIQPSDIARCRDGFKVAMAALGPEKKKKKKRKVASGSPFTVYFKFDSTELTDASNGSMFDIMQKIRSHKPKTVSVVAHTDLAGAAKYNKAWSDLRAAALEKLLKGAGAKNINLMSMGDSDPIVDTKKPNQTNRRAVIIFK
jgi:OOP family OmpA-OmpF porin